MKTKKTKKGLIAALSTVMVGMSILVASSTASASMSASASGSCYGPKQENPQGGTYCASRNSANCRDNSGCDGGGLIDIIRDILGL